MADTADALGESGLIALFAAGGAAAPPEVVVANGDDAAAWRTPPGLVTVATTDSLVEDVHFELSPRVVGDTPESLAEAAGQKLLAVNLSDLAAMGARPAYALLAVHAPRGAQASVARALAAGVSRAARAAGVYVAGGNVTRTAGPWVLAATLIGEARPERLLRRGAAAAGDLLLVSGTLGDARAGLALTRAATVALDEDARLLLAALRTPRPEVALGARLGGAAGIHAVTDVSDGLARDVVRLLAPQGLGARVWRAALPVSAALAAWAPRLGLDARAEALLGGEDYRLLLAVEPSALESVRARAEVELTVVGEVSAAPEFILVDELGAGSPLRGGFTHFGAA